MTLDSLLQVLHCHLAALQSSAWPRGSAGPALYLDEDETRAIIAELKRVKRELAARGDATEPIAMPPNKVSSRQLAN